MAEGYADKLRSLQSTLGTARNYTSKLKDQGKQTEKDIEQLKNIIENSDDWSEQKIERALSQIEDLEKAVQGQIEAFENDVQGLESAAANIEDLEQRIYQDEGGIENEIEDINQKLQNADSMNREQFDKLIMEDEDAINNLEQEAEELLGLAKLIGTMESITAGEEQDEQIIETEISELRTVLQEFVSVLEQMGMNQYSDEISTIQDFEQRLEEEIETDRSELGNEIQMEQQDVEGLEQEINEFNTEMKELYQEVKTTYQNAEKRQLGEEAQELEGAAGRLQDIQQKGQKAAEIVGEDESYFENLRRNVGSGSSSGGLISSIFS